LNKFRDGQRDAIKRAKAAAESGDVEAAVREVHTLKGLAGNIGAKRLQEKAALLEKLLNDMSSPLVSVDVFEGQTWGDCDHELQEVLKTLSVLELQPEQDFKHHGKNIENLESELNRLQELLEEDDAESVEKLQEIQAALPQGMVRDMSEHMDQYDFEEALEIFLVWKSSRKGSVDA
jgi:polar amino acid transport system substrate-binding protein